MSIKKNVFIFDLMLLENFVVLEIIAIVINKKNIVVIRNINDFLKSYKFIDFIKFLDFQNKKYSIMNLNYLTLR